MSYSAAGETLFLLDLELSPFYHQLVSYIRLRVPVPALNYCYCYLVLPIKMEKHCPSLVDAFSAI